MPTLDALLKILSIEHAAHVGDEDRIVKLLVALPKPQFETKTNALNVYNVKKKTSSTLVATCTLKRLSSTVRYLVSGKNGAFQIKPL